MPDVCTVEREGRVVYAGECEVVERGKMRFPSNFRPRFGDRISVVFSRIPTFAGVSWVATP